MTSEVPSNQNYAVKSVQPCMLFPAMTNIKRPGKAAENRQSLPASGKHHSRHFPSKDYSAVLNEPTLHQFLILWPPQLLLRYNRKAKQVLQKYISSRMGVTP